MKKVKHQYLVQQPRKLETLAISKLGDWIALQAERLISPELHKNLLIQVARLFSRTENSNKIETALSQEIEIIRRSLKCNVPRMLHDNLATEVIRALTQLDDKIKKSKWYIDNSRKNLIWRIIETLFNNNLTYLMMNTEMLRVSLYSKSYLLTGLQRLELYSKNRNCSIIDETNIIQMLKQLPSLKILTLEDVCTDNILKCLVEYCELIEELNIGHSKNINDKNIDIVTKLANLKSIEVYDTKVNYKGIKKILQSCDNMIRIGIGPDYLALALEHIDSHGDVEMKFKLQHFISEYEFISLKHLQLVIKMCPQIQIMRIIKDLNQTVENYLSLLIDLEDLHDLELQDFSFYVDDIGSVLEVRGSNLVHLHLVGVEQIDINVLKKIYSACPNLECLFLNQCSFLKEPLDFNGLFYSELSATYIPMTNLKKIALNAKYQESIPTDEQLLFLYSNCLNIEYINIGDTVDITDDVMLRVLDKNPLIYLKELILVNSKLSELVIDRIIQNCIDPPKVSNFYLVSDIDDSSANNNN